MNVANIIILNTSNRKAWEAKLLITWHHNITLIEKIKNPDERTWYIQKTIENGWSRNVSLLTIEKTGRRVGY